MMKWKSTIVMLVALIMILTACNSGNNETAGNSPAPSESPTPAPTEEVKKDEIPEIQPVEFTYYDHNDAQVRIAWEDSVTTQWVLENKQVKVNFISPNGAANQKLSTMIVGNDLPDVLNIPWNAVKLADIDRLIEGELVVPLDDYIEKYPNLKKWATMKNLDLLRAEDGHIYEIPVWLNSPGIANGGQGWMVNSKIYKELGSPKLETTTELEAYLRLVKEKYPDVVPLEVGAKFEGAGIIYSAFRENTPRFFPEIHAVVEGDALKPIVEDAAYQEFLVYVNRLFQDKLITQDAFTQTQNQVTEKVNSGRVAVLAGNVGREGKRAVPGLRGADPDAGYDAIWPIHKEGLDKNKIFPERYNSLGSGSIMISTAAKDPEAIFAFFDWVIGDEGQSIFAFGPPGLFWDERDDKGVPIPNEKFNTTPIAEVNKLIAGAHVLGNAHFVDLAKVQRDNLLPVEKRNWETTQQVNIIWKTSYDVTSFYGTDPSPSSEEGIISQQVKDIYDLMFSKSVFAKSNDELQAVISKATEDMEKVGIDKLLKYKTDIWQKNEALRSK